ncbi:MAG: hypothetical protein GF381_04775, partial [Candidatus Pacebacteria bacterium]|nr:hypothetical protein [Candidatus Paceibacterota bacterium]
VHATHSTSLALNKVVVGRNYEQILDQAFLVGRQGGVWTKIKAIAGIYDQPREYFSQYQLDQSSLSQNLEKLKTDLDQPATLPSAILSQSGEIKSLKIDPGKNGLVLEIEPNVELITKQIQAQLKPGQQPQTVKAQVELRTIYSQLTQAEIEQFTKRVERYLGKSLVFSTHPVQPEEQQVQLTSEPIVALQFNDQELVGFLELPNGIKQTQISQTVEQWADKVDQRPTNAEFEYDQETLKVEKFKPDQKGRQVEQAEVVQKTISYLEQTTIEQEVTAKKLPLKETEPDITLANTNDLGINELIGFGDSYYDHSIPSRIHNVKITADKLSLNIVPPGEKFAFNQAIGEVSQSTGYRPAYVIKDGRTMLGDGGGVCQVSTTLFRALLDAGVDITRRLPHSYRVSYYELDKKPGFDATVYSGNIDLRFVNDTPGHLLIFSQADSDDLYMKVEIYGTDDGRTTEITNYKMWGYQPPPPPQYIPDESLEPGQLKQVDWSASGIKAQFNWLVKDKNGEVIRQKTYYSNYRPWSAKYLQGV